MSTDQAKSRGALGDDPVLFGPANDPALIGKVDLLTGEGLETAIARLDAFSRASFADGSDEDPFPFGMDHGPVAESIPGGVVKIVAEDPVPAEDISAADGLDRMLDVISEDPGPGLDPVIRLKELELRFDQGTEVLSGPISPIADMLARTGEPGGPPEEDGYEDQGIFGDELEEVTPVPVSDDLYDPLADVDDLDDLHDLEDEADDLFGPSGSDAAEDDLPSGEPDARSEVSYALPEPSPMGDPSGMGGLYAYEERDDQRALTDEVTEFRDPAEAEAERDLSDDWPETGLRDQDEEIAPEPAAPPRAAQDGSVLDALMADLRWGGAKQPVAEPDPEPERQPEPGPEADRADDAPAVAASDTHVEDQTQVSGQPPLWHDPAPVAEQDLDMSSDDVKLSAAVAHLDTLPVGVSDQDVTEASDPAPVTEEKPRLGILSWRDKPRLDSLAPPAPGSVRPEAAEGEIPSDQDDPLNTVEDTAPPPPARKRGLLTGVAAVAVLSVIGLSAYTLLPGLLGSEPVRTAEAVPEAPSFPAMPSPPSQVFPETELAVLTPPVPGPDLTPPLGLGETPTTALVDPVPDLSSPAPALDTTEAERLAGGVSPPDRAPEAEVSAPAPDTLTSPTPVDPVPGPDQAPQDMADTVPPELVELMREIGRDDAPAPDPSAPLIRALEERLSEMETRLSAEQERSGEARSELTGFTDQVTGLLQRNSEQSERIDRMERLIRGQSAIMAQFGQMEESLEQTQIVLLDVSSRLGRVEGQNPADRDAVNRALADVEQRLQSLTANMSILARMSIEGVDTLRAPGASSGAVGVQTSPAPQGGGANPVFRSETGGFRISSDAQGRIPAGVKRDDFIEGYGYVLDVLPASDGQKLVVMENGSVLIPAGE